MQPRFFSRGVNPKVDYWKGSGNRTYSINYINSGRHSVDDDVGLVTYTLSAP
jgi:hypothetical protein